MNSEHVVESIPAYALGTLDVEDQMVVETHLAECSECRAEYESLRPVVASLAFAAEVREPSAELRDRVVSSIDVDSIATRDTQPRPRQGRRLIPFSAWALAAAAVFIGLIVWNVAMQVQLRELQGRLARQGDMVTVLALDPNAGIPLQGTEAAPVAEGRLIPHPDQHGATLAVEGMPAPPPGRVYQIWLMRPDGQRDSGGLFTVDEGTAVLYIHPPASLTNYVAVGITDEPAGGSPGPTGTKVLGGEL